MDVDDEAGGPPIEWLYAWISIDSMGGEGIVAGIIPPIGAFPFVGSNLESIRRFAGMLPTIDKGAPNRRYELRGYRSVELEQVWERPPTE